MQNLLRMQALLNLTKAVDWLGPLALRLYLVPVFWMAGTTKIDGWINTVEWFGNAEWGLGLPFPMLMAFLATGSEVVGAIALLIGLGVRWMCIPLMFTMVVAAATAHWQHGWLTIASGSGMFATERTVGAVERLDYAKSVLQEHGNYEWLTENGSLVILNNGIEFAATYFTMLLVLFFIGGGRYVSLDYWINRKLSQQTEDPR